MTIGGTLCLVCAEPVSKHVSDNVQSCTRCGYPQQPDNLRAGLCPACTGPK